MPSSPSTRDEEAPRRGPAAQVGDDRRVGRISSRERRGKKLARSEARRRGCRRSSPTNPAMFSRKPCPVSLLTLRKSAATPRASTFRLKRPVPRTLRRASTAGLSRASMSRSGAFRKSSVTRRRCVEYDQVEARIGSPRDLLIAIRSSRPGWSRRSYRGGYSRCGRALPPALRVTISSNVLFVSMTSTERLLGMSVEPRKRSFVDHQRSIRSPASPRIGQALGRVDGEAKDPAAQRGSPERERRGDRRLTHTAGTGAHDHATALDEGRRLPRRP